MAYHHFEISYIEIIMIRRSMFISAEGRRYQDTREELSVQINEEKTPESVQGRKGISIC